MVAGAKAALPFAFDKRLVTSFATKEDEIERFVTILQNLTVR
jgi:hypothetical protein